MAQGRETETLDHHHADLGDVRLHYVTAGSGFPVVLLHGWPQSWYEWRLVMPGLAERFRVIAPDLRGLGNSSRPAGGYDKKTVGGDIWRLANEVLGISEFHLVGHDWGGPTAYAVAAAHPEAVRKLAILDVTIPGDGSPNISQGGPAVAPCVSPDARLARGSGNRPRGYLPRLVLPHLRRSAGCHSGCRYRGVFAGVSAAGCVAGGFSYYRAIPEDIADNAATAARFKLPMPVLALGGDRSWGRGLEVVESLRRLAVDVSGGVVENCGHWMPEEQPAELLRRLLAFLG